MGQSLWAAAEMLKLASLAFYFSLAGLGLCQEKPLLSVYYESLCPYSRQFIREEVWPTYELMGEYFDVEFIAYGNARTTGSPGDEDFAITCQHGPRCARECVG